MFFDLAMAGIGVCSLDDIAISVLASVVGHQRDKGWILIDAGWMAMSRDRGTARLSVDQGYGVVCDLGSNPIPDLIVIDANQEHRVVATVPAPALYRTFRSARWCVSFPITPAPRLHSMTGTMS
jgi:D-serine deaminase-like pyridoxal phosphate-dependent protein